MGTYSSVWVLAEPCSDGAGHPYWHCWPSGTGVQGTRTCWQQAASTAARRPAISPNVWVWDKGGCDSALSPP